MSSSSMDGESKLHIAVFPWLAMGHLIPFLEFSKCLARRGHRISFISTRRNIVRLPVIPQNLSPLINLIEIPLPHIHNLPDNAESTTDLPVDKVHYLKKAFDGMEGKFDSLLKDLVPDWIIYDFAANWLPPLAGKLRIPCIFFSLFNASSMSCFGPPPVMMGHEETRKTVEDLTASPPWIPFQSSVVLRYHEVMRIVSGLGDNASGVSEGYRLGSSIQGSDFVIIRSCMEFESEWIHLLEENIYKKPVIPIGLLPPSQQELVDKDDKVELWVDIMEWLEKQKQGSVIYVALGTEATLTGEETTELAIGLELSGLPFFWVLRNQPGSAQDVSSQLPDGFEDRTSNRGFICKGWAPQVKILSHQSVGGFLTHCGWNSIIESLGFGLPLIMLPLLAEQGLNARVLEAKKIGLEIPRNEKDGWFTKDSVAESLRLIMVDEGGKPFRTIANKMKDMFGNKDRHDQYIDDFVKYLHDHRKLK